MKRVEGRATFQGTVTGRLCYCPEIWPVIQRESHRTPEEEYDRYVAARRQATLELAALYDDGAATLGPQVASIFAIHAILLEEEEFDRDIRRRIDTDGVTAEFAVRETGASHTEIFARMEDVYMRGRAFDIQDITRRLVNILTKTAPRSFAEARGGIILTGQLSPSELMTLDRSLTLGAVVRAAQGNSHTAILAKEMGFPLMVGVDISAKWDGWTACLSGAHELLLDPTGEELGQGGLLPLPT